MRDRREGAGVDNIEHTGPIVLQCIVDYRDILKSGNAQRRSPWCAWRTVFFVVSETIVASFSIAHVCHPDLYRPEEEKKKRAAIANEEPKALTPWNAAVNTLNKKKKTSNATFEAALYVRNHSLVYCLCSTSHSVKVRASEDN